MKRWISVLRCLRHGLRPPFIERRRHGKVHYEDECTYWQHLWRNIEMAARLAFFLPLTVEDQAFYT